jgi:hypothetical protein
LLLRRGTLEAKLRGKTRPVSPVWREMAPTEGACKEGASMEVTSTKAALVANGDVEAKSRLSVTLPRSEVEAALAEPELPELELDVLRATGEEDGVERRKISVEWDPADIKQLLEKTPGDGITFAFERDELERLLSEDVELHGLRDKALVLSVVAGVAAGGATSAMAMPSDPSGPPSGRAAPAVSVPHDEMTREQRGIETPAPASAKDELTAAQRGIEATVKPAKDELTAAQRGIEATVKPAKDELTASQRGIEQPVQAARDELTASQRGIEQPVQPLRDELTAFQRGIPDDVVAKPDERTLVERGIETPAVSTPEVASASDSPMIDPSTAAALGIAGGMGLLIAGAAFVARRQRMPHPA